MIDYKTIAESKNFIVLDQYTKDWQVNDSYQSESELERELIQDLVNQGYEYAPKLNTPETLLANVREQLFQRYTDGDADGASEVNRLARERRLVQPRLDLELELVRELAAVAVEELDAVVLVGVVRGRDHHPDVGTH